MNHRKPVASSLRAILVAMRRPARFGALGLGALAPLATLANPTGGQVVGGSATISTPSANTTVINQSSQRAAINWQQFSVGANQYVQFLQPDSSAVVLNRVIGNNPSQIFGNITANGQVFLINPNGILFGRGAMLDVSGLVASTQDLAVADFMAGKLSFIKGSAAPDATVINQGTIVAPDGYVVLTGDYVENDGVIDAQNGRVLLAAGGGTTLTLSGNQLISYTVDGATLARLAGVTNAGSITADGGTVVMTADVANALTASAVNNSGLITARSIQSRNGVIILSAQGADITNSGTLDASATDQGIAGGDIIIHGNRDAKLASTSMIDVEGNGAPGGFVDLSGHDLSLRGKVNMGKGGTLLLDPANLWINSGSTSGGVITSANYVGAKFIQTELNANANVVLVASHSISAHGVNGKNAATAITTTATGTGNLTLKTGTLTLHSGALSGTLMGFVTNHCGSGVCTPKSGTPGVFYAFAPTSGTINVSGVTINIKGALTVNAQQGTVTLGAVTANGVSVTAGTAHLSGSVNAGTGKLSVSAIRPGPASPSKITVLAGKALTGKSVNLLASASYGGTISAGAITATGGSMGIHAIGKAGTFPGSNRFKVKVGNLTATGAVSVGGQGLAGSVSVGNINAKGVNVNAAASGSASHKAKVTVGNIVDTGGVIATNISETGHSGSLVAGSISAAGAGVIVTAGNTVGGNITLGNVITSKYLKVSTNTAGTINVNNMTATGAVGGTGASKSDAVVINDTNGNVVQAVTGTLVTTSGNVKITAGHVTLGAMNGGGTLNVTAKETSPIAASFSAKGAITAKAVTVLASGSYGGKISAGAITATGGSITLHAQHATGLGVGPASINAGNLTAAKNINLMRNGTAGGVITVTGAIKSSTGSVNVSESTAGLHAVTLASTSKITAAKAVNVSGGKIILGSVSAGGTLTVTSKPAVPSGASIHVTAGKALKAGTVNLTASASYGGIISAGAITATGGSMGIHAIGKAGSFPGSNIFKAKLGNLTATGAVTVNANGLSGTVSVGNINAKGVTVGATATGSLAGDKAKVTVGNIVDTGGVIATNISEAGHSGSLAVGSISAAGAGVIVSAGNSVGGNITLGNVITSKYLKVSTNAGGIINVNNMTATGAVGGTGASKSDAVVINDTNGNVVQSVTGKLVTTSGNVKVTADHVTLGTVSDGGTLNVTVKETSPVAASFSAKGAITAKAVTVLASGSYGGKISAGAITATGGSINVTAAKAAGAATGSAFINAGNITATKNVNLNANAATGAKIAHITVGNVMATGGTIHISANDASTVTGSGLITAGNLTGRGVNLLTLAPLKSALNVGAISAAHINISAAGKSDTVVTGALTANNTASSAFVAINATANTTGGFGQVTVNGNVSVSGKPHSTFANKLGQLDLPNAAVVSIKAGGAGGPGTVKVNGAINVNAVAAAYSGFSANTGGVVAKRTQSGTGGVAGVAILAAGSAGLASVTGSITAKGPDAHVEAQAHSVTVHNVTVTGSGHHVSRSILARATTSNTPVKNSYASSNSAGQATVGLGNVNGTTSYGGTTLVKAGNITVSGKGVAEAGLFGTHVSAGNVSVTATAAKGHFTQKGNVFGNLCFTGCSYLNSASFYRGIGKVAMHSGSISGGRAFIGIFSKRNIGNGSSGGPAVSIKTGALGATGVGLADITLGATSIQTQGLTVLATKGTEKAVGSSQSGLTAPTSYKHTFNINGGEAHIRVRSGGSGSQSSGILTVGGGPVTIGGNISATGPVANVDVKGKTITVNGTVTVVGNGGALTSTTVVTPPTGTGYSTSFNGPGRPTTLNLQGGVSGSVNVAGKIDVKAPGLVGVILLAGGVNLHGLSGSASAVKTYTAKDTRVSTTANTFTIGSLAVAVDDVKSAAGALAFTSASDAGNVSLLSKGNVDLATRIKVGGALTVQGIGTVFGNSDSVVSRFSALQNQVRTGSHSGGGIPKPGALPRLSVNATSGVTIGGGNVDLTSAGVNAGKGVTLTAGKVIVLDKTAITAGSAFSATANSSISNKGVPGSITANGGKLKATTGNISLGGETLHFGTGNATLSAAGNISLTAATLGLGSVHMTAAGSIDLTGITLTAAKTTQLIANKNIILSGVNITTGTFTATASGTIHNGGAAGVITAQGMALVAKNNISLTSTQVNIGNGSVSSVHGDTALLQALAILKLSPAAGNPNGAFIAGGSLSLGGLKLTGSYLLLQGSTVSLLGPVSVPAGALVQTVPFSPTVGISIENVPTTTAGGFDLSNQAFLSLFPGDTIVVGNSGELGNVTVASLGNIKLASGTNLVIDTTGVVTGLSNVAGTGTIVWLEAVLGPPVPPVTSGEVDSTTSTGLGDQTDKRKLAQTGGENTGQQQNGTVSQDTSPASVCK